MDTALVSQIAEQVVRQQILTNWLYWVVMLAVLAVASFLGNWVSGYAGRRGDIQATTSRFAEILNQLQRSTQATEEIRSAVSIGEWSKKEQTTLRRIKLEELLFNALDVKEWWHHEHSRLMFDSGEKELPSPMPRVQALGKLYFPELAGALKQFDKAYDDLHIWLLKVNGRLLSAKSDNVAKGDFAMVTAQNQVRHEAGKDLGSVYKPFLASLNGLQQAAADLMNGITAVKDADVNDQG